MKQLLYFISLVFLLNISPLAMAQKNTVADLKKQRERTLQELEKTNRLLSETQRNETATLTRLQLLNKNIAERRRLIATLNEEIQALNEEMDQLSLERQDLQFQLDSLKRSYAQLVRLTHYQDMQQSPMLFVLSADNFNQSIRRIRYLRQFQTYRKQQVARIEDKQLEIDEKNEALAANRAEQEEALAVQQREQQRLAADEKKQQQLLAQLKKKEKELLAKVKQHQKKADELNKKIEDLIRQQAEAQKKQNGGRMTKEQELVAGGFAANKGRLPWPVEKGVVTGEFGIHPHPTLEKVTVNNKGLYIQTSAGAAVRAVYEGEVTSCFVMGGTSAIIIQHGNYRTVYTGLASICVKKGDKVTAKQKIGTIYTDPDNDNRSELFFQVWKDKDILNPSLWLTH